MVEGGGNDWLRQVLLPVKNEAASVIAEMRQNAKWANTPGMRAMSAHTNDSSGALLDSLLKLRFSHQMWADGHLTPMSFLQPFLAIITGAEASGPITAAALVSVRRLLCSDVLRHFERPLVAAAMHNVVSALTMCKFEATNPWHDQMVLCKILHTLDACLECSSGPLLGDKDVCDIFQASYRIGFDTQVVAELSELLVDLVRESLTKMVRVIFTSLTPAAPAVSDASAMSNRKAGDAATAAAAPPQAPGGAGTSSLVSAVPTASTNGAQALASVPTSGETGEGRGGQARRGSEEKPGKGGEGEQPGGYGVRCAGHILQWMIKLIRGEHMCHFALDMIQEAISAAGAKLQQIPQLVRLVQVDLVAALLAVFRDAEAVDMPGPKVAPNTVTRMTHTVLTMYLHLRQHSILQIEVYLQCILLPLVSGRLLCDSRGHTPSVLVEAAHECLVDFCLLPGFLQEAYACLDCRVEHSNAFEEICKVLSRMAHPRAGGRGLLPVNALALKGLLAVLHAMADGEARPASIVVPPQCLYTGKARADLWHAIIKGVEPASEGLMAQLTQEPGTDGADADAWEALCAIRRKQWEKTIKSKLEDAVQQFNTDYKKGFQFLQVNRLLPDPMDATSVAAFLRYGRGIDKQTIGNFMGKNDEFNQEVLAAYARTFPFASVSFDTGFRAFADTFKQPPESQQVVRFTKNFVVAFLEAHGGDYRGFRTVKCLDDFMTVSLWHNSTWYNANPKVPKMASVKMFKDTMSESISEHDAPEDDVFREVYDSVCATAFPQGSNEPFRVDMPVARLAVRADRSRTPRGQAPPATRFLGVLNRDMFLHTWGPSLRAVAALLEQAHAEDSQTVADGMKAIRLAAAIAKANYAEDVIDSILAMLARFTVVLEPRAPYSQGVVAFGSSYLAREAVTALFGIVADYSDMIRDGWATCLDCIMRLHRLRLVDTAVFVDGQAGDDAGMRLARARHTAAADSAGSTNNLFTFFFAPTASAAEGETTQAEKRAEEAARDCVRRCRIDGIFEDSKFLGPEALQALVRAVTEAAGPIAADDGAEAPAVDLEVAEACLELLIKLAVRNRDRIHLLLPTVNEHLGRIVEHTRAGTARLTQRTVSGLLRVCTRLLMYRQDVTDQLMESLKVIAALDMSPSSETYIYELAPTVARSLQGLVTACAEHVHGQPAWAILLQLLRNTCSHPGAIPPSLAALEHICREPSCLSTANYMQVVTAIRDLVAKASEALRRAAEGGGGAPPLDPLCVRSAVDLLEQVAQWLQTWRQRQVQASALPDGGDADLHLRKWYAALSSFWHHLLDAIVAPCSDWNPEVRNHAMVVLHRCLTSAGENLHLNAETWGATWREIILPMLAGLASDMQDKSVSREDTEPLAGTICLAVNILHKTFVSHITELSQLTGWRSIWLATLQGLKTCTMTSNAAASDEVRGAVVQAVGGMIQTMHARKLLWANTKDREGLNMWDRTFSLALEVSPELSPEILGVV